tara:strand:+ start:52 stop:1614 length:1563 start_codon:yes stop_codon:yes gene_type:complete
MLTFGIQPGDRVAGYLPNIPDTIIAMLASAAIGAIWSSCSPDFGAEGVLERFTQIEPKLLFSVESYSYNGQTHKLHNRLNEIVEQLPSVQKLIIVPYLSDTQAIETLNRSQSLRDFTLLFEPKSINFAKLPFNHPLFIMFSSGTTGKPKCIVHGAGGTLLQHLKEHCLHTDVKKGDRFFYFTTCGWMMWNWLVSGLASGACLLLYDGSPFYPDANALFDFAQDEDISIFGVSAKYIDFVSKAGIKPIHTHKLESLRTILSTGSPLSPTGFDFVYTQVKSDVCLSSISGGTDIIGCFALGNPTGPVWRGELQSRALGMSVEVFDTDGQSIRNRRGELVCTAPFPSMPVGFWNDPDDSRYKATYFEKFPGIWCHGDYVSTTKHDGMIIYGRSDTALNPGGVRIGTGEIYRIAEQFAEIIECIAVGQNWQNDERIILFVRLRNGEELHKNLKDRICERIRRSTSPRHVPAKVIQVSDIPRTVSGKITELAVRDTIHGRVVKNRGALANPEALEIFKDIPELSR